MGVRFSIAKKGLQIWISSEKDRFEKGLSNPEQQQQLVLNQIQKALSKPNEQKIPFEKPQLSQGFDSSEWIWISELLSLHPELETGVFFNALYDLGPQPKQETETKSWMDEFFAVKTSALNSTTGTNFYDSLSAQLLERDDLEMILLDSPLYLIGLMNFITVRRTQIHRLVRSTQIRKVLIETPIDWQQIWPNLKLIACYNFGNFLEPANELKKQLPWIKLISRGLRFNDTTLTIPWAQAGGFLPRLDQICLQFKTENGDVRGLHELETNFNYELLLTSEKAQQVSTGHLVRVTQYFHKTPCLEYVGPAQATSDLVGEAISESKLRECLDELFPNSPYYCAFPSAKGPKPRYVIAVDEKNSRVDPFQIEKHLLKIRDYKMVRDLELLNPAQVIVVKDLKLKIQKQVEGKSDFYLCTNLELAEKILARFVEEQALQI